PAGRPRAGEEPHTRHRGPAAGGEIASQRRTGDRSALAAHVLHGQSRYGQDDRGVAYGGDTSSSRLRAQRPSDRGHARRPRRPVHRAYGAQDSRSAQAAMGGVLFIDEAYYLYRPENERDYGQEAIEILLQVMENQREDLVVILAGYK